MPTDPMEHVLNRDVAKAANSWVIETAGPLLRELVNYGTNLFVRAAHSTSGRPDEDIAVLMLYLHVVEMTDGVEVLVSEACDTPAIPLVRSAFEAALSIEYILAKDTRRRALAWFVEYVHQRLAGYDRLDPESSRGKEFEMLRRTDDAASRVELPALDQVRMAQANLRELLKKPHLADVVAEYNRARREKRGPVAWHSLFGGPSSMLQMARRLNRGAQYEVFYRFWSEITHGGELSRRLAGRSPEGALLVRGLRSGQLLKEVAFHAATLCVDSSRRVIVQFRNGEEEAFQRWYVREVRKRYLALVGGG